jgi:poly(A) polymerase
VRDVLLGRSSFDLDFVTSGDALKIGRKLADDLGGAYYPLDPQRNVARVILRPAELGEEVLPPQVKVDISRIQGVNLDEDLRRRDFTINAMAVDAHQPESIMDPLHGTDDLLKKRLRACSVSSLSNDPVRILRGVRFSVDLGLNIVPETVDLMREAALYIARVSPERLRDELFRILVLAHPSTSLCLLDMLGVLEHMLPEVCLLKGLHQGPPHVLDAWEHTLDVLNRLESLLEVLAPQFDPDKASNLSLGLVALQLGRYRQHLAEHLESALNPDRPHRGLLFFAGVYHDVGKRTARSLDDKGAVRFIGHDQVGSQLAEKRGQLLKLSNQEISRLASIVGHHMRPSQLSHSQELPGRKAVYHFFRDTGAAGVDICLISLADVLATYGASLSQERWTRHINVVRSLLGAWWEDREEKVLPPALVDGDDLKSELVLPPGPLIGYLLESIREAQVSGEVRNREDALDLAREITQANSMSKGD